MVDEGTVPKDAPSTADLDARLGGQLDIDAAQLIEEIKARYETRFDPPAGSFTFQQFMNRTGYKRTMARRLLERLVEVGELTVAEWKPLYGPACNVWMRPDER